MAITGNLYRFGTFPWRGNHFFNLVAAMRTLCVNTKRPGGREMLSSVVDQCLSLALASASRKMSLAGNRGLARHQRWQAPLAAYPRLAAAMQRAEQDGVIGLRATRGFF